MNKFLKIYKKLELRFGKQGWWPLSGINKPVKGNDEDWLNYRKSNPNGTLADFRKNWPRHLGIKPKTNKQLFEIIIGAILTQNTSWINVEKAIKNLNKNNLINVKKIKRINKNKLAVLIKSSGYYNQKADYLKIFSNFLIKNYNSNIKNLFKKKTKELRHKLTKIKGIGNETADSVILYAAQKPVFIIDTYTKRIFLRLGICNEGVSYHRLQKLFMKNLPKKTDLFKQYHALLVELAKNNCMKKPSCKNCPINNECRSYKELK